jgi:hypothetical protein
MRPTDKYDLRELGKLFKASPTELPLRVVPDWEAQLRRAEAVCRLIDRHLETEAQDQSYGLEHLGPEQRVQLITDTLGLLRRR